MKSLKKTKALVSDWAINNTLQYSGMIGVEGSLQSFTLINNS